MDPAQLSRWDHSQNTSVQQDKSRLEEDNEGSKRQVSREKGEFYELQRMADISLPQNSAIWYNSKHISLSLSLSLMRWQIRGFAVTVDELPEWRKAGEAGII